MNTEFSDVESMSAHDLLTSTERLFARAAIVFERTVTRLEEAGDIAPKVAVTDADRFSEAFLRLMKQREQLGTLRHQTAGTVGGRTLDLDAARAEIGRRLACLRNGGGG
ncbi:MAG: hypothetical protein ACRC6I_03580 [Paracoccaceae bacterium]